MSENQLNLTAYQILDTPARIEAAPRTRGWMDQTWKGFANRCLPLLMANQHGWVIYAGQTIAASWTGESGKDAVKIEVLEDGGSKRRWASSHFGSGIITWEIPFLFRTPPGWNLYVKGPANFPRDGVGYLEGLVETDWATASFTYNIKITRPNFRIVFLKNDPLCAIVPQERGQLEKWFPSIVPLQSDAALNNSYNAWQKSRTIWNKKLAERDPEVTKEGWQKHYFQGESVDGTETPDSQHQSKQSLRAFKQSINIGPRYIEPERAYTMDPSTGELVRKAKPMRANEPDCKRWPEVCGEIADRSDKSSKVCQLPLGHTEPHDYDGPGRLIVRQGDLVTVPPVSVSEPYSDYYGICLSVDGANCQVFLSNGLTGTYVVADLEVLPIHPALVDAEHETAPASFLELVMAANSGTYRPEVSKAALERAAVAARQFLHEYRTLPGMRGAVASSSEEILARTLSQLDPL